MNWSEMSPRERDALVAEKVMGWHLSECGRFWESEAGWQNALHWSPTSAIACAWEVVDAADSYRVELNPHRKPPCEVWITYYPTGAYIESENRYEGEGFGVARAPTAPEAICLAALRAKGVEV